MGLERYVVDAVVLEGRSPTEIARLHGISGSWLYRLLARYREGGYPALAPRSRRPHTCAHRTPPEIEAAIFALRAELAAAGHDCGPATIVHHLGRRCGAAPSVATVWRILRRHGLITPQPHKRPRSSFIRFEAALPNELWQADTTHWRLARAVRFGECQACVPFGAPSALWEGAIDDGGWLVVRLPCMASCAGAPAVRDRGPVVAS